MVISSITEALLQLMRQKPLVEISISELCNKAGVSRISFYRNYSSMDDILVKHLTACTDAWWADFSIRNNADFYDNFWPELLEEYRKNRDLILLIYQNEKSSLLKEHIFSCCAVRESQDEWDAYARAGGSTGWWMSGYGEGWQSFRKASAFTAFISINRRNNYAAETGCPER